MNCCQRPKAEGNSSSEGQTDHPLPENPDNNCFVIPHFLDLCLMMNGQAPDKIINYTTQKRNTFFSFLPLMNHFSRQNMFAIAYKNHWFFGIQAVVLLQATQPVLSTKVSQNDAYFRHAHGRFFPPIFKRLFNRLETLVRYILCRLDNIFGILTVPATKN